MAHASAGQAHAAGRPSTTRPERPTHTSPGRSPGALSKTRIGRPKVAPLASAGTTHSLCCVILSLELVHVSHEILARSWFTYISAPACNAPFRARRHPYLLVDRTGAGRVVQCKVCIVACPIPGRNKRSHHHVQARRLDESASVKGAPDALVTVVDVNGSPRSPSNSPTKTPLAAWPTNSLPRPRADPRGRHRGLTLSFDGDGRLFRLVSEAQDRPGPPLRPLARRPHLARRPAAAPDHGRLRGNAPASPSASSWPTTRAGKTIMCGLLAKELSIRATSGGA